MGRVIVGTPYSLREYVERYAADSTCNCFVTSFQWGDLNRREASCSLELFTREAVPHVADSAVAGRTG
jgi:hypothetical protein